MQKNKIQVKVVNRLVDNWTVALCIVNEKGEELKNFLTKDYCCPNAVYIAVKKYLEENNMVEIHNEIV